jgi:hypothetical protein
VHKTAAAAAATPAEPSQQVQQLQEAVDDEHDLEKFMAELVDWDNLQEAGDMLDDQLLLPQDQGGDVRWPGGQLLPDVTARAESPADAFLQQAYDR